MPCNRLRKICQVRVKLPHREDNQKIEPINITTQTFEIRRIAQSLARRNLTVYRGSGF